MPVRAMFVLATLGLAACAGGAEIGSSKPADPSVEFNIPPPNVNEDWPCPPFGTPTTEAGLGDADGDLLADCQEDTIGSDPNAADSDGDGFSDYEELGDGGLVEPTDTDADGVIDLLDEDDDGDLVLTSTEGPEPDFDDDGIPNHVDEDDDNDDVIGPYEDLDGDGDPTNDDPDLDGLACWLDSDDDNDGVPSNAERGSGDARLNDLDGDSFPNFVDPDDDGDGIISGLEDADGDGDATNDDLDEDRAADFLDLDEDGDGVPTEDLDFDGSVLDHDSDDDGILDYRDADDDNDGVFDESDPLGKVTDVRVYDLDADGRPNYRDANDDGDGCDTLLEDVDGDGDPTNDNSVVSTGTFDPADYLDAAVESCASPTPELTPSWALILNFTNIPGAAIGGGLLVTVDGSGAPTQDALISNQDESFRFDGVLDAMGSVTVNVTLDLNDDNACTVAEQAQSYVITGLTVSDYDRDIAVDFDTLTVDLFSAAITQDAAACSAHD